MTGKYNDIIHLPHHVSDKRPRMSLHDRAAQFAPFAALTGHEEAIVETARLTDGKLELAEDRREELDRSLRQLRPPVPVTVTYYLPDRHKQGGAYVTVTKTLKTIDRLRGVLVMADRSEVPIDDLWDLSIPCARALD